MKRHAVNRKLCHREQGTTLIEVLVSLLILSVGMLGMAGLQTVSLRNTQSAYYRTTATSLGAEIVELMRANIQGVTNGNYDNVVGAATADCFTVAGCSPSQMAAQDIFLWENEVTNALPGGASVVCIDATGNDGTPAANACDGIGNIYAIKIWWDDNRDGTSNQLYSLSFQPE